MSGFINRHTVAYGRGPVCIALFLLVLSFLAACAGNTPTKAPELSVAIATATTTKTPSPVDTISALPTAAATMATTATLPANAVNSSCNIGPTPSMVTCLVQGPLECTEKDWPSCSYRLIEWVGDDGLLAVGDIVHAQLKPLDGQSVDAEPCIGVELDPKAFGVPSPLQRIVIRGQLCNQADTICICGEGSFVRIAADTD